MYGWSKKQNPSHAYGVGSNPGPGNTLGGRDTTMPPPHLACTSPPGTLHVPHVPARRAALRAENRGGALSSSGPSTRLRLHAARAAPASLLGMAAFHLHLTALRACCACTALLELMRRAHMRVPAEACEGAAGTYDLAADDAPPASAVARVSCRMAAAARVPPTSSP